MSLLNVALWATGVVLLMVAVFQARNPYRRMVELDRLADNSRRYDSWRGGRSGAAGEDETTGADIMRTMLRRRVLLWAAVAVVGAVLIIAGFAVR
jgi:hypothetical protein